VFFIEAPVDETSLFENREVKIEEIVSTIGKMTDLEDRISDLIDGEQLIREAQREYETRFFALGFLCQDNRSYRATRRPTLFMVSDIFLKSRRSQKRRADA